MSFELDYGETLGLVGESGCGKSVTALSIARLVPEPARARSSPARSSFDGIDVLKLNDDEMRKLRGKEIGFIFQDPLTSLNPTLTIGYQIAEAIRQHMGLSDAGGRRPGRRAAQQGRHPARPRPAERLPAPVLGRHAAARDDRHRARRATRSSCSPTSRRPRSTSRSRPRSSSSSRRCPTSSGRPS